MIVKHLFIVFLICLLFTGLISCERKQNEEAVKEVVKIQLDFKRLDQEIAKCGSVNSLDSLLKANSDVLEGYFQTRKSDSRKLAEKLFSLFQNPALNKFYLQSQQNNYYGNRRLEQGLTDAFQQIKNNYPSTQIPKIRTVFSGFGGIGQFPAQDLIISDSLIVIGLDYFMGNKGLYLPPNTYAYQMRRMSPEAIVGQIILLYSAKFNLHETENSTLLSDMIWYGKGYNFTKKIMPNLADSLLFGYSSQEIAETEAYQSLIWEHFIDKSLLYKQDEFTKTKYLGERPKTTEIGPACPGSIGRWLGYTIVKKYQEKNAGKSLVQLMNMKDATVILQGSGYRGKADKEEE
ncbi:gliding motility protein [Aquirufa sp. ROCK2-A2]